MSWRLGRVASGMLVAVSLSGCAINGLSFQQDKRISIIQPADNAEMPLPLEVTWTAQDFDGYYAVFFDRSPMKPGQNLQSLVPENDPCRAREVCPDAAWLADRNIYVTDATTLQVAQLPDRRDNNRSKDRHEMVIVLLDPTGARIGESAFTNEFIIERED